MSKKSIRERKNTTKEDLGYIEKDNYKHKSNFINLVQIAVKCESVLNKIKEHPDCSGFMSLNISGVLSLPLIEKKIKANKYKNINEFKNDMRNMWTACFQSFYENPVLYKQTVYLSEHTENVFNETLKANGTNCSTTKDNSSRKSDSVVNNNNNNNDKQKHQNKKEEIFNDNNIYCNSNNNSSFVSIGYIANADKIMSYQEKNELAKKVNKLTGEHLKNIIRIVTETKEITVKNKVLELYLNKLPNKKLREIEMYIDIYGNMVNVPNIFDEFYTEKKNHNNQTLSYFKPIQSEDSLNNKNVLTPSGRINHINHNDSILDSESESYSESVSSLDN